MWMGLYGKLIASLMLPVRSVEDFPYIEVPSYSRFHPIQCSLDFRIVFKEFRGLATLIA